MRQPLLTAYAKTTGVVFEDIEKPISSYSSVQKFFQRTVKPRKMAPGCRLVS